MPSMSVGDTTFWPESLPYVVDDCCVKAPEAVGYTGIGCRLQCFDTNQVINQQSSCSKPVTVKSRRHTAPQISRGMLSMMDRLVHLLTIICYDLAATPACLYLEDEAGKIHRPNVLHSDSATCWMPSSC